MFKSVGCVLLLLVYYAAAQQADTSPASDAASSVSAASGATSDQVSGGVTTPTLSNTSDSNVSTASAGQVSDVTSPAGLSLSTDLPGGNDTGNGTDGGNSTINQQILDFLISLCDVNETFSACVRNQRCGQNNTKPARCLFGCECKLGYARSQGQCIPEEQCPSGDEGNNSTSDPQGDEAGGVTPNGVSDDGIAQKVFGAGLCNGTTDPNKAQCRAHCGRVYKRAFVSSDCIDVKGNGLPECLCKYRVPPKPRPPVTPAQPDWSTVSHTATPIKGGRR